MDKLFSDINSLSQMSLEKAEKNLSEIRNYIENDFQGIARILESYHPLEIMRRIAWTCYENEKKRKDEYTLAYYRLLPLLLQSILISTHYKSENFNRNRMVKSKDYDRVLALSMDVHRKLLRYIDCKTVRELCKGTISKADAERYRTNCFKLFYPPKENSERIDNIYSVFDSYAQNEDEKIEKVFRVKGSELSAGFKAIADGSLTAIDKLSADIKAFKSEVEFLSLKRREDSRYKTMSEEDMSKLIIRENKWESRSQTLAASRDDFDLFRPEFYSSLSESAYDAVSAEIGSLDLYSYLDNGLWPASMRPFIKNGTFIFTFLGSHMISYGNRMLMETIGTNDVPSRTAQYALSLLFTPTDVVDVYSFDGNKIDLIVLPTMLEVNPYIYPERFTIRLHDKNEELQRKSKPGHNLLIVDPDTLHDELHSIGDHAYCSSAAYLLKAIRSKEGIKSVHQTIFGTIEFPDVEREYDDALLDSELDTSEPLEDELLDDYTSDDYEYAEDEEALEKKISERESKLDEEPEDLKAKDRSEELLRLKNIYELTPDIVKKEEEEEKEREPLENELDEVEYQEDDDTDDDFIDDAVPEDEELYDEVEKEDVYEKEAPESESASIDNSDQLDFLALLDDDSPEEKELTDELIEDDEKSFEEEEEKAEALDKEYSDYVDSDEYEDLEKEDGVASKKIEDAVNSTETSTIDEAKTSAEGSDNLNKEYSDYVDSDEYEDLEKEDGVASDVELQDVDNNDEASTEIEESITEDEVEEEPLAESTLTEESINNEEFESETQPIDEDIVINETEDQEDNNELVADETEEPIVYEFSDNDELEAQEETLNDNEESENDASVEPDESLDEDVSDNHEENTSIDNDDIPSDLEQEAQEEVNKSEAEETKEEPVAENKVTLSKWFAYFNNDFSDDSDDDSKTIGDITAEEKDEDDSYEDEPVEIEDSDEDIELDEDEKADEALEDREEENKETGENDDSSLDDEIVAEDDSEESAEVDDSEKEERSVAPLSPSEERLLREGIKRESDGMYVMTGPSEYDAYQAVKESSYKSKVVIEKADEKTEDIDAQEEPEDVLREDEPQYEEEIKKPAPEDMIEEIEIPELEESEEEKFLNSLSGVVLNIVKVLGSLDGKFVKFLKDSDKDMLNYLNTIIESSWKRQQVDHKDKLFSIYDYSMSVLLAETPVRDELRLSELLNNAGAVMYSKDADEWTALILYIDENYTVEDAMETTFTRDSFSQSDWKRIVNIGEILKSRSAK